VTAAAGLARQIDRDLHELGRRPADAELRSRLAAHGRELLPALGDFLARDLPLPVLEVYEDLYKGVLRAALAGPVAGPAARELAGFQLAVGLLLKYKSYAVKAASPLGYSIFLQNPGEGFSFQRHVTHKTEVFHILDAHPGGFVFLCSHEQWLAVYEPGRFAAWLAGERDPRYERYRFAAAPGDVFVLDRLGVVHTVVGCVLEEFATISTDHVERLHDQNAGRPVPPHLDRAFVGRGLAALRTPPASRLVEGEAQEPRYRPLPRVEVPGGSRTQLADGFVTASERLVEPGGETAVLWSERRAAALYIRAGRGRILLGTAEELARPTPPSLAIAGRQVLTIPPGIRHVLINEERAPLEVVAHEIEPAVALI
jgi:mannose-6-phosphate isomerase-like protein (cupin superfamily)